MKPCSPGWTALLTLIALCHGMLVVECEAAAKPLDFATNPAASQNARPLSLAHSFERFDLDQSALDERKYTHNDNAMLKNPQAVPRRQAYKSNLFATDKSMIAVDFACHPPPWATEPAQDTCAKVQKAFQGVFQHVEDAFDFKRPIKVKFEYSSFCAAQASSGGAGAHLERFEGAALAPPASMKAEAEQEVKVADANFRFPGTSSSKKTLKPADCSATSGLLGYAAPAAFWVPDVADPATGLKYSYPQALVKQLLAESRNSINFNEFDIYARFNADQEDGLWFKDEVPFKPIRPTQYDFQYIVLHEFMHGMGLVSSWNMPFDGYASKRGGTPGSAMLAPILVPENPSIPVPTPLATTIFDKYISTTSSVQQPAFFNHYAADVFGAVNALPAGATTGSFYKATLMDAKANQAAARAFQAATTARALQFSFPDGTSMLLHSEDGRYLSGTSIVHVNYDEYTGTSEFLMRPYANNGATLESLGKGRPFGLMTLKVFQTLGYTIRPKALAAHGGVTSKHSNKRDSQNHQQPEDDTVQRTSASSYWVRDTAQDQRSSSASMVYPTLGLAAVAALFTSSAILSLLSF